MAKDDPAGRPNQSIRYPLESGFNYRPTESVPEAQLDDDAIQSIEAGFKSIDAARLDAASKSRRYIIG